MDTSKKEYPPAIIGVGKNYLDHAIEMGMEKPPELPLFFMKNPSAISGDGDTIQIPTICKVNGPQVDYEGELAVIIGQDCKNVSIDDALSVVGGYAAANDVSARWWQRKGSGGQFCKGKSFDTFCPISAVVPASEVPDPQALKIETKLNGEVVQSASTSGMLFSVKEIIHHLSAGITLRAGTVILTGTPGGVGDARKPPVYLKHGDIIEVEIIGVGKISNKVVEEE